MKLVWGSFLFELLIIALIKSFVTDFELISTVVVSLHAIFVVIVLMSFKSKFKVILLWAFIARGMAMAWDLYARRIFIFPGSGGDSEMFFSQAVMVSHNLALLNENIRGELYGKIIGLIFYFIGPQRMVAQYINVLIGLSTIFVIYKTLIMLDIRQKNNKIILLVSAFLPNSIIMSALLLREIIPTFFVALSLYFFIKWFNKGYAKNILISIIMLGLASMFHIGVIGLIVGYFFAILFYKRDKKIIIFSLKKSIIFGLICFVFFEAIIRYGKFSSFNEFDDIYNAANYREGGSVYLTNLIISSPFQLIIYGPIRAFYFIASPLPFNWRGFNDIFTFISDSTFYIGSIIYLLKSRKYLNKRKALVLVLGLAILSVSLIFGIGVSNAGTALRHRQKIIPFFLVLIAVIMEEKQKILIQSKERYR